MRKAIIPALVTTLPPSLVGTSLTYRQLSHRLNRACRPLGSMVRVYRDKKRNFNKRQDFDVSAYFDTEKTHLPISLTVHVDPKREVMEFTDSVYRRFMFRVAQTLHHECIHAEQMERRAHLMERRVNVQPSKRMSKEQRKHMQYLSDHHEIEAYAHDIAMEIVTFYPRCDPMNVIKRIDAKRYLTTYRYFSRAFLNTEWESVHDLLIKKIMKWVPTAPNPYQFLT